MGPANGQPLPKLRTKCPQGPQFMVPRGQSPARCVQRLRRLWSDASEVAQDASESSDVTCRGEGGFGPWKSLAEERIPFVINSLQMRGYYSVSNLQKRGYYSVTCRGEDTTLEVILPRGHQPKKLCRNLGENLGRVLSLAGISTVHFDSG